MDHGPSTVDYSYDGYGRRISRLVKGSGMGIPEAEKTEYLWDGTNVLVEFYQNQNNPLEYVYGNGQLISRDDLLVLPVSKRLVYQNTHWFHQDGLGSIVNLSNFTGSVSLTYGYDAFGKITREEGEVGWKKNRYTFTGKPYDPTAEMYYFGARWYEPEVGRFVTKDPILGPVVLQTLPIPRVPFSILSRPLFIISMMTKNQQYLHSYVYVTNNPINFVDPYGLCEKPVYRQRVLLTFTYLIRGVFILGQENLDGSWAWGIAVPTPEGNMLVYPYWGTFEWENNNYVYPKRQ